MVSAFLSSVEGPTYFLAGTENTPSDYFLSIEVEAFLATVGYRVPSYLGGVFSLTIGY
jgi:hypothetical protein